MRTKKLKLQIKKQRNAWVTGTYGRINKPDESVTEFEQLLARLHLTEDTCHLSEECAAWCHLNKDRRYIPERVLYRLRMKSLYDEEQAPFSLIDNTLIPEPKPLEETEVSDEPQAQAQS